MSSWPPIRPNDGLALQDFSIALDQAKSAMKGMSHMDDLNTAHVLRQLWEKLPKYLRTKWTERNNRTKSAKGRIADFEEFSQFVREQADLATDSSNVLASQIMMKKIEALVLSLQESR